MTDAKALVASNPANILAVMPIFLIVIIVPHKISPESKPDPGRKLFFYRPYGTKIV